MYGIFQTRPLNGFYPDFSEDYIACDWESLRTQLLDQWKRLSASDVDHAGPSRSRIARLVERKYGVDSVCVENYLRNFERTMPL